MEEHFTNTIEWLNRAQKIAGIGIWNQDILNDSLWWSDQTYLIFGMKPQSKKMNFKQFLEMVQPEYKELIIEKTKQFLLSDAIPYNVEYKIISKDNIECILQEEALIKRDNTGKPIQIIGIIKDITKQRKAELELIRAKEKAEKRELLIKKQNKKLQELNSTKDKFFSIIAHDLKSPFNCTLGFSNILLKKHKNYDNEKREKIIKSINDSANNAFNLLENLLTWSCSQLGGIKYLPENLNLKTLLFEIMFVLQEQANKKNISILDTISYNELIYADRNMIATILRNLISNAIKFTNKNGNVVISSKKQINSNFLEISIIDTGVGISEEKIDNLFCISKKTSTQGTENETGTGLGLIVCKEFIEKHDGEIWIESEITKGSSFYFTVPCKQIYTDINTQKGQVTH